MQNETRSRMLRIEHFAFNILHFSVVSVSLWLIIPNGFTMPTQIKLPNLGENIESGDVLTIFVSEGDVVKADQDLLEVETDKATMPIPSPEAGKITKILVREGDTIEIGAPIM
jgi:multidrug efflux pump subunit AcrA (membrane-fusion protein)